ncbi:hypothetical protein DAI22_11g070650 [Oryza sativa Japonica Group]|nr:hypothetical protein DAI22_11g070650 [Oryza sativa Japonica Group]
MVGTAERGAQRIQATAITAPTCSGLSPIPRPPPPPPPHHHPPRRRREPKRKNRTNLSHFHTNFKPKSPPTTPRHFKSQPNPPPIRSNLSPPSPHPLASGSRGGPGSSCPGEFSPPLAGEARVWAAAAAVERVLFRFSGS